MSIALMSAAFVAPINATQKLVLLALCDCANDQGECYPSVQKLLEKTSLKERAVQAAMAALEAAGYMRREFRNGRSTVYWMTPKPPHDVHHRTTCTPAPHAPTHAPHAPHPPHHVHPTPAPHAPITVTESSIEPSLNRKRVSPPTPPPDFNGENADVLNGHSVVCIAAAWELPEAWGNDAEALGWKPAEVLREAERFRQYWVVGRGQGKRRTVKGWRQSWSNWLSKAARDIR